jgi:hypothetical protein
MLFHRDSNPPGRPPDDGGSAQLVGETEAFLAGALAEAIEARAGAVPDWVWINGLAHGTPADITAFAAKRGRRRDPGWRRARALLAQDLLDAAKAHGPLDRLQRDVLVPLELRLAASPVLIASPAHLVTRVLAALALDRVARNG